MDRIYLDDEFKKFWDKIESNENFALMRSGDGEYAIMTGRKVRAREGWESPANIISKLGKDLYQAHQLEDDTVYYGISCPDCDREAYYWYSSHIPNHNRTFANIWVNANYSRFKEAFSKLRRDAIVIANYRAQGAAIGNLNILRHYSVSDDCFSFWENNAHALLQEIINDFGSKKNLLYVISAGPMSGAIIAALYKHNPHNCYIDFGSVIDSFYREQATREYMDPSSDYAQQNCWMHNPHTTSFDISVVMNLYKHPEGLEEQLLALEQQNLKVKEILLYQDGTGKTVHFPSHLTSRFTVVEVGLENKGVWERFYFAQRHARCPYICVFDDDTIPGRRWLENCHYAMMEEEGMYGAVGIVLNTPRVYPFQRDIEWKRLGWPAPNVHTVEVDFVGHAWFFKRTWLPYMLDAPKEVQLKRAGEDMAFSYQLQQYGIKTFVPPHPEQTRDLFGSIPERGVTLGTLEGKVHLTTGIKSQFTKAINILIDKGWKVLRQRDRALFNAAWNMKNGEGYTSNIYLLGCIPLLKHKYSGKKNYSIIAVRNRKRKNIYYLFKYIPLFSIHQRTRKRVFLLFNVIPVFTIERVQRAT